MSDHLPECPMEVHKGEDLWDDPLFGFPCWCYALRAREQRVLAAAREAVEKWFVENRDEMTWPEFLSTVDAMKEKE